jgi:DNA-binding beta-propeller fold protein YncE
MTRLTLMLCLLALLCLCACGPTEHAMPVQAPTVTPNLFATGAAPNDIEFAGGKLYVANSLDNTLTVYTPAGASAGSFTFAQGASPAFLITSSTHIWAVSNGDNTVTQLPLDLGGPHLDNVTHLIGTASFIGPADGAFVDPVLYVPRNEIAAFGPTTYGPGLFSLVPAGSTDAFDFHTVGKNPQAAVYDPAAKRLYIVTAGEIQFDSEFHPSATTDSFLEAYDVTVPFEPTLVGQANLGLVGANCVALAPGGEFAYLGNSLNGNLYKVQLSDLSVVRGLANPIALTAQFTFISDVKFRADGRYLFATSFNTDELYVIDVQSDTASPVPYPAPLDLNPSEFLAGALRMVVAPGVAAGSTGRIYIVMSVANSVAAVDLY